nr:T9SS type A sorting domain-containing protein [Bacteroidota bacterium]
IVDNERWGMNRFLSHDHSGPIIAGHYYNYIRGIWKDGTKLQYGGNGFPWGSGSRVECNYMFPGTSDPLGFGTGGIPQPEWSEITENNVPWDRRFMLSSGPFTLEPGGINSVSIGVSWARDMSGDNLDAITALQKANDKAQKLADDCFNFKGCVPPLDDFHFAISGPVTVNFSYFGEANTLKWNFGDGKSSKEKYLSHVYRYPGIFEVSLEVKTKCGNSVISKQIDLRKGTGVALTRLEGHGSGGYYLALEEESIEKILNSPDHKADKIIYKQGAGPVSIEIMSPLNFKKGNYTIFFTGLDSLGRWKIFKHQEKDTVTSDYFLMDGGMQDIPLWGIRVITKPFSYPGKEPLNGNGFIGAAQTYKSPAKKWLKWMEDDDLRASRNWIRAGRHNWSNVPDSLKDYEHTSWQVANNVRLIDPEEDYENIIGGGWAPYKLVYAGLSGLSHPNGRTSANMGQLQSVDVVITSDTAYWTRCAVIELCDEPEMAIGNAWKNSFRKSPSVGKNGMPDGSGNGMGWFPGYALCLETGERLNMAFGENSWMAGQNGRDMIWNPGSHFNDDGQAGHGGKHAMYVFRNSANDSLSNIPHYDGGEFWKKTSNPPNHSSSGVNLAPVWRNCMWVGYPMLIPGKQLLETDVTISLRVHSPFGKQYISWWNNGNPVYEFTLKEEEIKDIPEPDFSAYPNPFKDFTYLNLNDAINGLFSMEVYNLNGSLLSQQHNLSGEGFVFQRNGLQAGVYIIQLRSQKAKSVVYRKKLVVVD